MRQYETRQSGFRVRSFVPNEVSASLTFIVIFQELPARNALQDEYQRTRHDNYNIIITLHTLYIFLHNNIYIPHRRFIDNILLRRVEYSWTAICIKSSTTPV